MKYTGITHMAAANGNRWAPEAQQISAFHKKQFVSWEELEAYITIARAVTT